jgi:hypothetical protein
LCPSSSTTIGAGRQLIGEREKFPQGKLEKLKRKITMENVYFSDGSPPATCSAVKKYGSDAYGRERVYTAGTPGVEIDRLARSLKAKSHGMTYEHALNEVFADPKHAGLKAQWAAEGNVPRPYPKVRQHDYGLIEDLRENFRGIGAPDPEHQMMGNEIASLAERWRKLTGSSRKFSASDMVHELTQKKMRECGIKSYKQACDAVLAAPENAQLKAAFARSAA